MFKLLTTGNAKTVKGIKAGFMTYILHLAPAEEAGRGNVCPKSTPGCRAACLHRAGQGGMLKPGETKNHVHLARERRTQQFFDDRDQFMLDLYDDIARAVRQARRKDLIPVFRLNGTSDLSWEKYTVPGKDKTIFECFPSIQFYDYTKVLGRKVSHIPNYHLTFSRAENNDADVQQALAQGMNVAVVYDRIPDGVYSADNTDLRFLDPIVGVVGLRAKGPARKDTSGFVIRIKQVA